MVNEEWFQVLKFNVLESFKHNKFRRILDILKKETDAKEIMPKKRTKNRWCQIKKPLNQYNKTRSLIIKPQKKRTIVILFLIYSILYKSRIKEEFLIKIFERFNGIFVITKRQNSFQWRTLFIQYLLKGNGSF